jgi:hypothetical protein
VEKTFRTGGASALGVYVDLFNLNNQGVAQAVNTSSGPNFGLPTTWSAPRTVRVGMRMIF